MQSYIITIEPDGGFTVPSEVIDDLELKVGDEFTLEVKNDALHISKISAHPSVDSDEKSY